MPVSAAEFFGFDLFDYSPAQKAELGRGFEKRGGFMTQDEINESIARSSRGPVDTRTQEAHTPDAPPVSGNMTRQQAEKWVMWLAHQTGAEYEPTDVDKILEKNPEDVNQLLIDLTAQYQRRSRNVPPGDPDPDGDDGNGNGNGNGNGGNGNGGNGNGNGNGNGDNGGWPGSPKQGPGLGDPPMLPPDLENIRNVIGTILAQQIWAKQGFQEPLDRSRTISSEFTLEEGLVKNREIYSLLSQLQQGLQPILRQYERTLGGQDTGAFKGPLQTLAQIQETGGVPDITRALAAIRSQGLQDIDVQRAAERERFGEMGLASGSDVSESVMRGSSQGVSDLLARQESLIAQTIGQGAQNRMQAAGLSGQISSAQLQAILSAVGGRSQAMGAVAGGMYPGAQAITGIGVEKLGMAERNELREYEEFLRMNPDYMNQGIGFATGSWGGPQKPIVQGSAGLWGSMLNVGAQLGSAYISRDKSNEYYGTGGMNPNAPGSVGSSRELKDVDAEVNISEITSKMAMLPIHRWNYKGEKTKHLGPMAEDFSESFGVGDGKTIHLADVMGVVLAVNKEMALKSVGGGKIHASN